MIRFDKAMPVFPANDREPTIDFFSMKLGFALVADHRDYLIFEKDGVALHCSINHERMDPKTSTSMAYFYIRGVDELYDRCLSENIVHPNSKLKNQPYGLREFSVLDPTGNLIHFGELLN